MGEDWGDGEAGDDDEQGGGGADPGYLLGQESVGERVATVTAVLFGVGKAHEAGGPVGLEGLPWELGSFVGLRGVGREVILGEAPQGRAELLVLGRQDEGLQQVVMVPAYLTWVSATWGRA